jgi:hypothetical protein
MSNEYSTGMIRTTLAAMPRRPVVLAAQATLLTGAAVAGGIVAVGRCLLAVRGCLRSRTGRNRGALLTGTDKILGPLPSVWDVQRRPDPPQRPFCGHKLSQTLMR